METGKEMTEMATKNEANNEWKKKNTLFIGFRLYNVNDADLIQYLKTVRSKQGTIKAALRYYIANGCPEPTTNEEEGEQE